MICSFSDFLEREKGGGQGENHQSVASLTCPDQVSNLQPRSVWTMLRPTEPSGQGPSFTFICWNERRYASSSEPWYIHKYLLTQGTSPKHIFPLIFLRESEGKRGSGVRETHILIGCLPFALWPGQGMEPATVVCALDKELNPWPFDLQADGSSHWTKLARTEPCYFISFSL